MYESRLFTKDVRPKPTAVLDQRFKFMRELEVGDTGQLDVVLSVREVSLVPDINGEERLTFRLNIDSAKILGKPKVRI